VSLGHKNEAEDVGIMQWRSWLLAVAAAGLIVPAGTAQSHRGGGGVLKVFFVDVEGGQATLFVTPAGQSLLVDTGWPGNDNRDADRIADAAAKAGVRKIDYVLLTHYHVDHAGGVPQLLAKIPVGAFIDHGPNREEDTGTARIYAAYEKSIAAAKMKRITVKPGDILPIVGMKATVISSDGELIGKPLDGAGTENAFCKESEVRPPDVSENGRSVGIQIEFGKLKLLDLGDLTWDKEMELMCPANKLGQADVLIVSHHGMNLSSSPALVKAIAPRVAIMDNGAKKGGSATALETISSAPGLETLWQLHFSEEGGQEWNTADSYIANLDGPDNGNDIELTGKGDGSFEVLNPRTAITKRYPARESH
jgi:beta-lactamase superfamily II metal-dependent hydrolase